MLFVMDEPGLRERKKAATRQRISDVATGLFAARGFDNVSVAEVAEAAEVAKMTVFNYFPRKEDLLLDRGPELIGLVTDAIRNREPGRSPLAALHRLFTDLARQRHPASGVRDGVQTFYRTVLNSPALLARVREQRENMEQVLAGLLAEATGTAADAPGTVLLAMWTVGVYRTVYVTSARRILAGEHSDDILPDHLAQLDHAFAALSRARLC